MKKLAVLIILGLFAFSCGAGKGGGRLPDGPVNHQVILSGSYSKADNYEVKLIKTEEEWTQVWSEAKGNEEPIPDRPTVNFDSQYVIAAFMGERNSSGYKIEIESVVKKGKILQVHVKKYETPGMLTVMTQPFTLVRVPRGDYDLEVTEESVQ